MFLKSISKYRTELMGFAMLLVVWHHLPMSINLSVYDFLKLNAGFGVDIFLLLSGIGLYFSTYNGLNIKKYAIKRSIRIFPFYVLIIIVTSIIYEKYNPINILLKVTTIGWWTGHVAYDWFIPNLVVLYVIYPFYFLIIKQKNNGIYWGMVVIVTLYAVIFSLPYGTDFQALYRYPVFLLGVIIGRLIKDNVEDNRINISFILLFIMGCCISVYAYIKYNQSNLEPFIVPEIKLNGWLFIPYIFIVTGFCILVSYILSFRKMDIINRFLRFIGRMSLEVYLLHGQFINLTRYLTDTYCLSKPLVGVILILFSFVVAYWAHLLNIRMMDVLKSKLLK